MIAQINKLYNLNNSHIVHKFQAGNCNESFLLIDGVDKYVLRSVNSDIILTEQCLCIQNAIHENTKIVARPHKSINDRYIESITLPDGNTKSVSLVNFIEGESHEVLEENFLSTTLCSLIGNNIAMLHIALQQVKNLNIRIPRWYEHYNCLTVGNDKHIENDAIVDRYLKLRAFYSQELHENEIIHGDIHFDNIIIGKSGAFFCDFDDVCFGDYRMDLALLLFDLAIIKNPLGDWKGINTAANTVITAYNSCNKEHAVKLEELYGIFNLLELKFYIDFRSTSYLENGEGWIKRFLTNRKESIDNNHGFWRTPT